MEIIDNLYEIHTYNEMGFLVGIILKETHKTLLYIEIDEYGRPAGIVYVYKNEIGFSRKCKNSKYISMLKKVIGYYKYDNFDINNLTDLIVFGINNNNIFCLNDESFIKICEYSNEKLFYKEINRFNECSKRIKSIYTDEINNLTLDFEKSKMFKKINNIL